MDLQDVWEQLDREFNYIGSHWGLATFAFTVLLFAKLR